MTPAAPQTDAPKPSCLLFRLDGKTFSVDCRRVVGVFPVSEMRPAPGLPPWVRGALDLAGAPVPVVDMRARLDAIAVTLAARMRIVVVEVEGDDAINRLGIVADAIVDGRGL